MNRVCRATLTLAGSAAAIAFSRRTMLKWGARPPESRATLPGDDLLSAPSVQATRAISIAVPPERVWPWLVQLGQGRGGFYSYDALENLAGLDIHSADRIEQDLQYLAVGDQVRLAEEVSLSVARLDPQTALVLHGTDRDFNEGMNKAPFGFSWSFVLFPEGSSGTRLVVRERYTTDSPLSRALVEMVGMVSFVMSQKMLRGIRDRAELAATKRSSGPAK